MTKRTNPKARTGEPIKGSIAQQMRKLADESRNEASEALWNRLLDMIKARAEQGHTFLTSSEYAALLQDVNSAVSTEVEELLIDNGFDLEKGIIHW